MKGLIGSGTWGKQLRFASGSEENGVRGHWDKHEGSHVTDESKGQGFHKDLLLCWEVGL